MGKVQHDLTDEQWAALMDAWAGCAYCGSPALALQKDCVLPISRGGRYTLTNVVPACRSCNASKCNDEVTGWLRRKKLDERAFLVRHHEIGLRWPPLWRSRGSAGQEWTPSGTWCRKVSAPSSNEAVRAARGGASAPPSGGEDAGDRGGCPARLEHLSPADAQRLLPGFRAAQVTVQVVPSILRGLMVQAAVQLDDGRLRGVLDVALDARTVD